MDNYYRDDTSGADDVRMDYICADDTNAKTSSSESSEFRAFMERIEKVLCGSKKKRKHKKKDHKGKGRKERKKLQKRLKAVESQNEQIVGFLRAVTTQSQKAQQTAFVHSLIEKSAPKVIDLISTMIQSNRSNVQYLPSKNQLYLTDGNDRSRK